MKKHLLYTIQNPQVVAKILQKHTNKKISKEPLSYAIAVCPECKKVKGLSACNNKKISHKCFNCSREFHGKYEDFDYWFYHKPLAIPRLEIFDIDICITGSDHYDEGDFTVRQELIKAYGSKAKPPKTLYTQVVLGPNGDIMGKSRGNAVLTILDKLMRLYLKHQNQKTIKVAS